MADYYAILKRAIGGLPEPTGESRRSVYEKARTALVAQLKSFDPPLSASEITQQRLQLEDAIRKVESESAKGLLSQALNRASLPERSASAPVSTPPDAALPEPVTQSRQPQQPASADPPPVTPTARPTTNTPEPVTQSSARQRVTPDQSDGDPTTGPARPPLARPQPTSATPTGVTTGGTAGMRVTRPQFEPIARPNAEPERVTGQPPAYAPTPPIPPRPAAMPPPIGRDRSPTVNGQRRSQNETPTNYEQEDVTQPVANRALKKAVTDIDRLGSATQETARRARDALAATETPLDEELSTGGTAARKTGRKPLASRDRPPAEASSRSINAPATPVKKRGSRWPMVIGLVVAALVVGLGATALYTKRDLIASYLGTQKPLLEMVQRASSEKPIVKSTDRLLPDDATPKSPPTAGVKVVTTQPISPAADPGAATNPGGHTDVTPATPAPASQPTSQPPAPPAPAPGASTMATSSPPVTLANGDVPPIAQKASLLEEATDGTSPPIQTQGKVIWQLIKTPSGQPDKPDIVRLQGRVEIPGRGIVMFVTMEQNTDAGLQASHLIKLEFKLPPDFDNKSVSRVPGIIMKTAEQARGDPLAGATAKITSNLFWIALYAADADKANNLKLIKDRGWIDIPIVYETNKRAMLTLEKAGAGDRVFNDAIAAWGG
jgi:hypothetical protein